MFLPRFKRVDPGGAGGGLVRFWERCLALLGTLRTSWLEVLPSNDIRDRAARLLRVHPLRAADALQLAAAQLWAGTSAEPELVTLDERLALPARLEVFRVRGGNDVG
jgi:predicted nucleic acid-binding protein